MTTRDERESARYTRDRLDATARELGHVLTWRLGLDSTRRGHAYFFVGTCTNCAGEGQAGAAWTSTSSVVDVRSEPCGGPGTAILTEIETARRAELLAPALAAFAAELRRAIAELN